MISGLSGIEKATLLLSILGPQKASRILRFLPDDMANLLSSKVATLPPPDPEVISALYSEISNRSISAVAEKTAIPAKPDEQPVVEEIVEETEEEETEEEEEQLLDDLADEILADEEDESEVLISSEEKNYDKDSILLVSTKKIVNVLKEEKNRINNLFLLSIDSNKSEDIKTVFEMETGRDLSLSEVIEVPILARTREVVVKEVVKKAEMI